MLFVFKITGVRSLKIFGSTKVYQIVESLVRNIFKTDRTMKRVNLIDNIKKKNQ